MVNYCIHSKGVCYNFYSLYGHTVGSDGATSIAKALKINQTLQILSLVVQLWRFLFQSSSRLWNNNIGDTGAKAIAEALRTNQTLQTLE